MQWNIGIARGDISTLIRQKKYNLQVKWLPVKDDETSVADPFVIKKNDGSIIILYEDFSMVDKARYGTLRQLQLDANFNIIAHSLLLDEKKHLSYPAIIRENGKTLVIPESRHLGNVFCYEYNVDTATFSNKRTLIENVRLLDPTFLKHGGKYWLFATIGDRQYEHSKLYIYYADSLEGPYTPHPQNPVKYSLRGARPAGNFIIVDNEIYRPAQNCKAFYGQSLIINKILKLSETEFEEEEYMEIKPDNNSNFNKGIHTINVDGDIIVVDGIRLRFDPLKKLKLLFQKN